MRLSALAALRRDREHSPLDICPGLQCIETLIRTSSGPSLVYSLSDFLPYVHENRDEMRESIV